MLFATLLTLLACKGDPDGPTDFDVVDFRQVVPSAGLPPEVTDQDANNNLDVTWHDGRLFLAFRTSPNHFASPDTVMYVISSTDEKTWRYEGRFALDTDVREPQLVSWNGELFLWFAVLGDNPLDFEPQGAVWSKYQGPGAWSKITWYDDPTFIPWRIKEINGTLYMIGYSGGANVYDFEDPQPIQIQWLTSTDAVNWKPAVPGHPVLLEGGGSETDLVLLDDGTLIAVVRNEAGDEDGFGSKICRAEAGALHDWRCETDLRKYDSPLLFRHNGGIWLIGRRNVTDDGHYDLQRNDLKGEQQYLYYQGKYWGNPKRCALWQVDPDALTVTHVLDLPSRGDTCFPEMVLDKKGEPIVYNYSSPVDGPDVSWVEGQTGLTNIYRQRLVIPKQ